MPATEQTWRNQKVMHIIFGVSTLVMTVATLWLLAKDHNREWKDWQLANRNKEAWMIEARHDLLADQFADTMGNYDELMRDAQVEAIDPDLVSQFKETVEAEDRRLVEAGTKFRSFNTEDLGSAITEFDGSLDSFNAAKADLASADEAARPRALGAVVAAQERSIDHRMKVLREFEPFIAEARRREKQLVGKRKFVSADRTAAVSELGLMEGGGASEAKKEAAQERIQGLTERIKSLTASIAAAKNYRLSIEGMRQNLDAKRAEVAKEKSGLTTELARLQDQVSKNSWNLGEWITRWPVLNALYDGNVRIDQIWLPELTINYNFSRPARFDRCKTCHQSISQTAAGSPTDPAYPTMPVEEREQVITMATPDEKPAEGADLREVYGMVLAPGGVVNYADVTVHYVLPESAAAKAGLQSGDVIRFVADEPVYLNVTVTDYLLTDRVEWGEEAPAKLTILRGLDHPFTSHPRLDLYLTDPSPHPEKKFGCTICHDGQGSGTEFPWTSHTPNNAEQQIAWTREHGWFDNHHWIFPMKPQRFEESNCMKCHHQKGGLEPSERFPEPPAPKLVEG